MSSLLKTKSYYEFNKAYVKNTPSSRNNLNIEIARLKRLCRAKTARLLKSKNILVRDIDCAVNGCPYKAVNVHHWDYSEPLDITFACFIHHWFIHSNDKNTIDNIIRHF